MPASLLLLLLLLLLTMTMTMNMNMRTVSRSCGFMKRMQSSALPLSVFRSASSQRAVRLACAYTHSETNRSVWWIASAVGLSSALIGHNIASSDAETPAPPGHPASSLPLISYDMFKKGKSNRVWVTLDGGVYDVTSFMDAHPGGTDRIQMVNGGDLAKYWGVYQLHDRPHIRSLLEEYRIGNLSACDYRRVKNETTFDSYYLNDPPRPAGDIGRLRIPSIHPWNSEPKDLSVLVDHFFTPNEMFFVRNHNSVPLVDESDFVLEIDPNPKANIRGIKLTMEDLKTKFPRHEVISALQCAGNRQEDYVSEHRPLYVAPHWRNGAIGNARWAGVKVRDVLEAAGMPVDDIALRKVAPGGKIVNFIAMDTDETGVPYAGVIPIEKALDPYGDAILAYEMNGETLPRDHGYPIRLLAPGHAGCRNVKWVTQIIVSDEASELDAGARLDRHFAPDINWMSHKHHVSKDRVPDVDELPNSCQPSVDVNTVEIRVDQGPVIQTLPVQSIVCVPANRITLSGQTKTVKVAGVAWSGAGRGICRVEVSLDGGKTFKAADLVKEPSECTNCPSPEAGMGRNWSWTQFHLDAALPADAQQQLKAGKTVNLEVVSKAVDGDFNAQPEKMDHGWNVLGICVNHWSKVHITLDPALPEGGFRPPPSLPKPGSPFWGDGVAHTP